MSTATLLVELFTEELPPKALKKLGDAFASTIQQGLSKRGLLEAGASAVMFATPRRLATQITNVLHDGADEAFTEKLMPVSVGLDKDGNATPALQKKLSAKSLGHLLPKDLLRESDGKVDQLIYRGVAKGQSLQVALQSALAEAIATLPVPKMMSYQLADGVTTVQFVRPVHGLVTLHGADVIDVHVLGLKAGRMTHGHRFQGAADIELKHADEYETRLETEGGVIASFEKRRHEIERLLFIHAEQGGDTLGERDEYVALLDEVTALVEMPTVYAGKFEAEFLEVPAECLVLTMKLNQKYFPLYLSEGGLSSRFLIVSNMRLDNPHNIIEGNQRVVRPRLSDARFFFETDKKTKLVDRIPKLSSVVYHNKLGSQGERIIRLGKIAEAIARLVSNEPALATSAAQAARLAKADLVTEMVGEFPELQGTMGKYYAIHEGIASDVAEAIEDHYKPRFSGDTLPRNDVGVVVALADKLETIVGMFGIGQFPTGDKDPFALRRHAIGVIRILVERILQIGLAELLSAVLDAFGDVFFSRGVLPTVKPKNSADSASGYAISDETAEKVTAFIFERFAGLLREQDYTSLEVEAVLSINPNRLCEVANRLNAVRAFTLLQESKSLSSANKRIGNILKKSEQQFTNADPSLFVEPAERSLYVALQAAKPVFDKHFAAGDYTSALKSLAPLKTPVDAFFNGVMVNAEDPKLRANRLALLADLHSLMNRVADLSKLAA